ncbi:MAG: hypothetical protein M0R44_10145 [Candidatus Marinimicrobia bacterium]|jgi:hypothetical protein|nr:hypothetical protein [Candidatus Neomarinimicrobiota bacterium]
MIQDVLIPGEVEANSHSRIFVRARTADLLRRLAKASEMSLSGFLDELIRVYSRQKGWEIVEDKGPEP